MFKQREVDVEPGVNPNWRHDFADISVYSAPFLTSDDTAIYRKGEKSTAKAYTDFKGKTIGVYAGFYYPTLQAGFDDKSITRLDFKDDVGIIKALSGTGAEKRVDTIVMNRLVAKYWFKHTGTPYDLGEVLDSNELMFRFHKDNKANFEKFNAALREELAQGLIPKLMKKMKID